MRGGVQLWHPNVINICGFKDLRLITLGCHMLYTRFHKMSFKDRNLVPPPIVSLFLPHFSQHSRTPPPFLNLSCLWGLFFNVVREMGGMGETLSQINCDCHVVLPLQTVTQTDFQVFRTEGSGRFCVTVWGEYLHDGVWSLFFQPVPSSVV